MKRRARRVTLSVTALGAAVVGVLVILNWRTVREHVEAWRFQLTRETITIEPNPALKGIPGTMNFNGVPFAMADVPWRGGLALNVRGLLCLVANHSGVAVVFDPEGPVGCRRYAREKYSLLTSDRAMEDLGKIGWRFLEQRFPCRAFVAIRDESP